MRLYTEQNSNFTPLHDHSYNNHTLDSSQRLIHGRRCIVQHLHSPAAHPHLRIANQPACTRVKNSATHESPQLQVLEPHEAAETGTWET
ncbi:hypothetical protein CY34DRAFT_664726 [Suillus luteus UH-Slu-Lm8-n1]|uniref:Unplaced genomic scaffold CY34scaffold_690, whole genome shotgun sequence n=1 Tax=Suillus luteus UH-Slu-Lm8-n1 TaxID=930992 RepID=A0A0C9ZXC5_9AGAM|nr:hypothetical protein CY34DRAFT_664726 [Suillus luteus UH-Slu-Lm8-n1]